MSNIIKLCCGGEGLKRMFSKDKNKVSEYELKEEELTELLKDFYMEVKYVNEDKHNYRSQLSNALRAKMGGGAPQKNMPYTYERREEKKEEPLVLQLPNFKWDQNAAMVNEEKEFEIDYQVTPETGDKNVDKYMGLLFEIKNKMIDQSKLNMKGSAFDPEYDIKLHKYRDQLLEGYEDFMEPPGVLKFEVPGDLRRFKIVFETEQVVNSKESVAEPLIKEAGGRICCCKSKKGGGGSVRLGERPSFWRLFDRSKYKKLTPTASLKRDRPMKLSEDDHELVTSCVAAIKQLVPFSVDTNVDFIKEFRFPHEK